MAGRGMRRRAVLAATAWAGPAAAQGLSPEQRREVLDLLRDALTRDPTILRDAMAAAEAAAARDQAAATARVIAAEAAALFDDPADPVLGNPRGTAALVEFTDPRCPYCRQLHPIRTEALRRNPALRVVMKEIPALGAASLLPVRALLAAQRLGGYAALQEGLMRLREEPTEIVIKREAERAGLDWRRLRWAMDEPATAARVDANLRLARALRLEGTPTLVVGGRLVSGFVDLAAFEQLVAEARG